jgi:hypothetical protein
MNYEQAFAIVGLDTSEGVDIGSVLEAIAVEKVVWTRERAESEVLRLNRLKEGESVVYFWTLTRVEQRQP